MKSKQVEGEAEVGGSLWVSDCGVRPCLIKGYSRRYPNSKYFGINSSCKLALVEHEVGTPTEAGH